MYNYNNNSNNNRKPFLMYFQSLFDILNFINDIGVEHVHFIHDQTTISNQITDNLLTNITV